MTGGVKLWVSSVNASLGMIIETLDEIDCFIKNVAAALALIDSVVNGREHAVHLEVRPA